MAITTDPHDPNTFRINGGMLIRILLIVARGGKTRQDLQDATGYSQGSITRLLGAARAQFGVEIRYVRGYGYVIDDWGVFNPECFRGL